MLATTVKSTDLKKLKSFILEKAPTCLHKAEGILKYRFVTPTYGIVAGADDNADISARTAGHYLQMYDWDSCLFSQAENHLGLTNLAKDVVLNFLTLKQADGYIPRTVSPHKTWDGADLCKPLLCQSLLKENLSSGFKTPIAPEIIQDLDCYLSYFDRHRRHSSGLYHWRNMLESGIDDNLALIYPLDASNDENGDFNGYPDGKLIAVDICSWLVAEFTAFSDLASKSDNLELAKKYTQKAQALSELIENMLWNETLSLYCNLDPESSKQVQMRAFTGLMPVFLGFAKPERAHKVIEQCVLNTNHFLRPAGLASVAASEYLYNQAKRGLYGRAEVSNWQGPVWVIPNVLAVRGLLKYGYKKEAEEIALRILNTLAKGLDSHGTMYENYNAETSAPLWAPNFMSWNVLSLELLELVES